MVGALQQNNFMIPSLNTTVTWTGVLGDTAPNLSVTLGATPGNLYYNFFRIPHASISIPKGSRCRPLHITVPQPRHQPNGLFEPTGPA